MAHRIEIHDSMLQLDLDLKEVTTVDDIMIMRLYLFLKEWHSITAIKELNSVRDLTDPNIYTSTCEHTDSRMWYETWTFADGADQDPAIELTVTPGWKPSEFEGMRAVQEQLAKIRSRYGFIGLTVQFF